ncbi:MAG: bleomycin resistance family protein [Phycisphaerales bacterium]|nr:bleomycin resistance family protein [Phycisphaerales bacterium]
MTVAQKDRQEHYAWLGVSHVTPILNVSNLSDSFVWFEKLGFRKCWDWGDPPSFGSVGAGQIEIFLCHNGQGGRGNLASTGGSKGGDDRDKGVWMSLWVDDVDAVHRRCVDHGLEVTRTPTDEPWGVREMHVRHPDGHVFRMSKGKECM